jgi:hypothetical protein
MATKTLTREEQQARREAGKAKAEAAIERLDEGVRALVEDDEAFAEYLRCSARMHNYSWGNRLLIWLQRPDASLVAGFKKWRELDRPVLKGSKGIQILAPMVKTFKAADVEDASDADENGKVRRVRGFRVTYVFAVEDTDGEPIGRPMPVPIEDDGDEARAVFAALLARADQLRIPVEVRTGDDLGNSIDGLPSGWYDRHERSIVVNAALPAGMRSKTLAHELAHAVAEHGTGEARRDAETVAEGAALVVAAYFGLDTLSYSAPYVAGWSQDLGRVRQLLESIAAVASDVIGDVEVDQAL